MFIKKSGDYAKINMAQQMYKNDALLHLVWTVATCSKERGAEKSVTPEEDTYLDLIRKTENITIDWDGFNAKRKELGWKPETSFEQLVDKMVKNDLKQIGL